MKEKLAVVVGVMAAMSTVLACYSNYTPPCEELELPCPDGSGRSFATCKSDDKKELNKSSTAVGYATLTSSSGTCLYSCSYKDSNGQSVGCDTTTVDWTGSKPSPTTVCPAT
jgi:hypothetical protein